MTICTPIRNGHGRVSTMYQSAPFRGGLLETPYAARYDLDPAECDQVVAVRITEAGRQACTERV
jgi:hypothetical protein